MRISDWSSDVCSSDLFALLPAQNATGNWIKVVQRVPVRIELDPEELKTHPLRVGLSMDVEVDVSQDGDELTPLPQRHEPAWSTKAFADPQPEAEIGSSSRRARVCR